MKTQYIVKAYEEELGNEFFLVTVPEGTDENEVYENFEMAGRYANVSDCDNKDNYDKHFRAMVNMREECCGTEVFQYYLTKYCKYKVKEITYDFEFEW